MTRMMTRGWHAAVAGACVFALLGAGVAAQKTMQITGAGATFPDPIYEKWFAEYNKLHPDIQINYQAQGSGAGIRQITAQTVFFGASDGPMTNDQIVAAPGKIYHFPTVLGGVVPIYNIPNVPAVPELKFTGAVLADIYLGKITKWNDPKITSINPGINLPGTNITVVHRAEGSGTSYIWCDYLAKVSPEWKSKVGVATSVNWPVGLGGQGSDGVTALVKQTPGSIGYVELVFAMQQKLSYGSVQAHDGQYLKATLDSVTAAAASAAAKMPADFRVSITNAEGAAAYPVASFTWLLLYENPGNKAQSKAMVDFVKWALTDGQKYCADLGYAPLPPAVVQLEMAQLAKIKTQ